MKKVASNSKKSVWTPDSRGTRGSIREVAISRSVSSRTMSAADRPRSWRSANKNKSRDHGSSHNGPKARKNVGSRDQRNGKAGKQMQIRSKVGSRDQRDGPQSRADKNHQAQQIGGVNGKGAEVARNSGAVTVTRLAGPSAQPQSRPGAVTVTAWRIR